MCGGSVDSRTVASRMRQTHLQRELSRDGEEELRAAAECASDDPSVTQPSRRRDLSFCAPLSQEVCLSRDIRIYQDKLYAIHNDTGKAL